MTEEDAYRALNVERTASPAQIRQAYLDLVKVWHPDRFEHDPRLREKAVRSLQEVNDAYAMLQGKASRSRPAAESPRETAPSAPPHAAPRAAPPPPPSPEPPPAASTSREDHASSAASIWQRVGRYRIAILGGSLIGIALAATIIAMLAPDPAPAPPPDAALSSSATDIELPPRRVRAEPTGRRDAARPESGTDVRPAQGRGRGTLSIRNDRRDDAVIVMRGDAGQGRTLYVRRGEKITMLDIAPGDYDVTVVLGRDWLGRAFAEPAAYLTLTSPIQVHEAGAGATVNVTLAASGAGMRNVPAFAIE